MQRVIALLVLCVCLATVSWADDIDHRYEPDEDVVLWVNKVGPYYNPQETYSYYSLPFCKPPGEEVVRSKGWLGEALEGTELVHSGIPIRFQADVEPTPICAMTLTEDIAREFRWGVTHHYWYQMYIDDLPVWGMLGEVIPSDESGEKENLRGGHTADHSSDQAYIYTRKKFSISYNNDQIIEVNLTSETPMPIDKGVNLVFTYSVEWVPTTVPFESRFDKYLDYTFFEHQIHWFSIFNSFMMVVFLVGLVSMILMRTLNRDYARYSKDEEELGDEMDRDLGDESGWKQVHGDVFRAPKYLSLFSALVGTGYQLLLLVLLVIVLATAGSLYRGRGSLISAFITCYALTSFAAGYTGGGYYLRHGGEQWIKTMLLTASLFPGLVVFIAFTLNWIAIWYNSLAAIPFGTMVVVILIWAFISFPLTLVGTVVGRNWNGVADFPCRIAKMESVIPEKPWYVQLPVLMVLGGILPTGAIFIEMYFIFTSIWNYKFYYVYGFMFLVFLILVVVTVCVTIVEIYFLLNAEDYRWQWTAFISAASTAGYVYLYSIYYFFVKTRMSGFFQTCFYFGYMAMFSVGFGIMCGTIGFVGSSMFVHRIYRNVKID